MLVGANSCTANNRSMGFAENLGVDMAQVPETPGCYQFKDDAGRFLYVGKAGNLKRRLRDHLVSPTPKIERMLKEASSLSWILCGSENEALLVEAGLVGKHQPRYNSRLKSANPYGGLAVDLRNQQAPRMMKWRGGTKKGVEVLGPFPDGEITEVLWRAGQEVLGLRTCKPGVYKRHEQLEVPCILAEIGRCAAPCVGKTNTHEQQNKVKVLLRAGRGNPQDLLGIMKTERELAAKERKYEKAARLRDTEKAARKILSGKEMPQWQKKHCDVWAIVGERALFAIQLVKIRNGSLTGTLSWTMEGADSEDTVLAFAMLETYGQEGCEVREVLTSFPVGADVEKRIREVSPRNTVFRVPVKGTGKSVLALAQVNADSLLQRSLRERDSDPQKRSESLGSLGSVLGIDAPWRIECFDISHHGGRHSYAGMVVLEDALPVKRDYRLFRVDAGGDDYAAMSQAVKRRYRNKDTLPDLLVVDGGLGQLTVANRALKDLGVDIPAVGLAKRFEEIWQGNTSKILQPNDPALHVLQRARDEAHRFSRGAHRRAKNKVDAFSHLEVPGFGPKRKKMVLAKYKDISSLKKADAVDLSEKTGVPLQVATALLRSLNENPSF